MFSLRADAEKNPEGEDGVGKTVSKPIFFKNHDLNFNGQMNIQLCSIVIMQNYKGRRNCPIFLCRCSFAFWQLASIR